MVFLASFGLLVLTDAHRADVTISWQVETVRQSFASTPRHYLSHRETRFPVRARAGDPVPPFAELRTFRRQDRSVSFGPRPSRRQDIIFAHRFTCRPNAFESRFRLARACQ
jgi:hypothetical protein